MGLLRNNPSIRFSARNVEMTSKLNALALTYKQNQAAFESYIEDPDRNTLPPVRYAHTLYTEYLVPHEAYLSISDLGWDSPSLEAVD